VHRRHRIRMLSLKWGLINLLQLSGFSEESHVLRDQKAADAFSAMNKAFRERCPEASLNARIVAHSRLGNVRETDEVRKRLNIAI
jgi:hypothetical protein